ncbi:MAG: inositol monophosphatase [Candidatus Wallbacteria bacterium HGW-Wallbacteria-1]|jgi:myo-inositol-1(or 4)-monophosphatase|uniref:Inositol-1-monophosphatase n=1 Tax=Candidatus Wallbacteria bacterium HGW-Wallbacteria-1 TaxID=2013854 RepID=A0A2N1PR97_9BACT|nr:MAG: inositol monophosphatase [Candidatus Wallbacteria bacterium HGW-Wallbacteria-1]
MTIDLSAIHDKALSIAKKAGTLLREHFGNTDLETEFKGENNMVTSADKASQELIISSLKLHFPDHMILAEEDYSNDDFLGNLWVIDPLDGTTNFYHGFPVFSVSIAFCVKKKPMVGVVYDPMRDEMFTAIKNRGAYLNGKPINVSGTMNLSESLLGTGFPYERKTTPKNNLENFQRIIMGCHGVRRAGSAALDLCSIASGRLDAFWELKLKPWDIAAGALIIQEAGGVVNSILPSETGSGALLCPADIFNGDIIASNGNLSRELAPLVNIPDENNI